MGICSSQIEQSTNSVDLKVNSPASLDHLTRNGMPLVIKTLLLGSPGCGKTALMTRYVKQEYMDSYKATIGADFLSKQVIIGKSAASLQIWDTAGQERFNSLISAFYRGADCVVLVFDLTDRKTLFDLETVIETYQKFSSNPKTIFFIAGNKSDLVNSCVVTESEVQSWIRAKSLTNTHYYETSAKTGEGVENLFSHLAQIALQNMSHDSS
jgi:Ras-related protein Rab-7A